jgi:hypothetical protein
LKGSVSWARRKARSSVVVARSRITGAEKPRRSEGTGRAGRPSKVKLWVAPVISRTVVGRTSSPFGFRRPERDRDHLRLLVGLAGGRRGVCVKVRV